MFSVKYGPVHMTCRFVGSHRKTNHTTVGKRQKKKLIFYINSLKGNKYTFVCVIGEF
jgi:hypothetical protein